MFLMRYRESIVRKRNKKHGTQDPMPNYEGITTLNSWKNNMFIEDDNRKQDIRRLFILERISMDHSKWIGKHNGDGTYDVNAL